MKTQIENLEAKNSALEGQHQTYLENNIQFNDDNLIKKRANRVQMEDVIIVSILYNQSEKGQRDKRVAE